MNYHLVPLDFKRRPKKSQMFYLHLVFNPLYTGVTTRHLAVHDRSSSLVTLLGCRQSCCVQILEGYILMLLTSALKQIHTAISIFSIIYKCAVACIISAF